jgi:CMP/dCMP kinase
MAAPSPRTRVVRLDSPLLVTIDGPAGTGKSSVALALSRRLRASFLDTGAMYRAAALVTIQQKIDPTDEAKVVSAVDRADIGFDWDQDPPMVMAMGKAVGTLIREPEVTRLVSPIATHALLRARMVERQRAVAKLRPRLVTEGRDQGTAVFPDATVKIYLDAHPAVRAGRRAIQLANAGQAAELSLILRDILERDWRDENRAADPLKPAPDAVLVDTSGMTKEGVVDELDKIVRART